MVDGHDSVLGVTVLLVVVDSRESVGLEKRELASVEGLPIFVGDLSMAADMGEWSKGGGIGMEARLVQSCQWDESTCLSSQVNGRCARLRHSWCFLVVVVRTPVTFRVYTLGTLRV